MYGSQDSGASSSDADPTQVLLNQARALVCEFASGQPTQTDRERIRAWRQQGPQYEAAWRQACQEWRELGHIAALAATRAPPRRRVSPMRRRLVFGGAVAAAGAALGVAALLRPPLHLWPSLAERTADYRTDTGEQRELDVAPGIMLALNTRTSLARSAREDVLELQLIEGEVALAAHGAVPGLLRAGAGWVRTFGGAVEVRCLPGQPVRVRCSQGVAEVGHPQGNVALTQGRQLVYDDQRIQAQPSTIPEQQGWREGLLVFRESRLTEVIDEINRYRPGHVFLRNPALAERRLSAHFSVHAVDEALDHIRHLYGASLRRLGGGMVVLS